MHTICKLRGTLRSLEEVNGNRTETGSLGERPVLAHLKYHLSASPREPLIVEITGRLLFAIGSLERLTLANGIVLTGRSSVIGPLDPNTVTYQRMFDVEEEAIRLVPDETGPRPQEIDTVVFGIVSSSPLAQGACAASLWGRPGRPFLFLESPLPEERAGQGWVMGSNLHIRHQGFEISFAPTSRYWEALVDSHTLEHSTVIGVRKESREPITEEEFNQLHSTIAGFLGWVNHCTSPIFHLKAYRRGRLVYRAYDLHPHATPPRDPFSWLPRYGPEGQMARPGEMVEHALQVFGKRWIDNINNRGILHIALQLLRSREKGHPRSRPSVLYLRDTFSAIGILTTMLIGPNAKRSRHQTMMKCIEHLRVPDRIPDPDGRKVLRRHHPELWSAGTGPKRRVQESERKKGQLSRPMANVQNWLLHMDDPQNASWILGLGTQSQQYFVEVSIWLADLMLMRVVGYEGSYFNRLSRKTESVPWVTKCKWAHDS